MNHNQPSARYSRGSKFRGYCRGCPFFTAMVESDQPIDQQRNDHCYQLQEVALAAAEIEVVDE